MNQPVMGGVAALNVPAYIKHNKLINWVAEIAALTKPDAIYCLDLPVNPVTSVPNLYLMQ